MVIRFQVLLNHCPLRFVFLPVLLSDVEDHERTSPTPLLSFSHTVTTHRGYLKELPTSNDCHSKASCHILTQFFFLLKFFLSSISHLTKSLRITHFMQRYKNSAVILFLIAYLFFLYLP